MMHRILMNIMQSSQVTGLMREMRLAKVMPEASPPGRVVTTIQFLCRKAVELLDHTAQRLGGIFKLRRTVRDEMIVVGEHGPSFELPAELVAKGKELILKPVLHFV